MRRDNELTVYIGNDMLIYVLELRNGLTSTYINSGTVTGQLKKDGVDVGDPLTFSALGVGVDVVITDERGNSTIYTDGNWRAQLEEDVADPEGLEARGNYTCRIDVDAGGDLIGRWEPKVNVEVRR